MFVIVCKTFTRDEILNQLNLSDAKDLQRLIADLKKRSTERRQKKITDLLTTLNTIVLQGSFCQNNLYPYSIF